MRTFFRFHSMNRPVICNPPISAPGAHAYLILVFQPIALAGPMWLALITAKLHPTLNYYPTPFAGAPIKHPDDASAPVRHSGYPDEKETLHLLQETLLLWLLREKVPHPKVLQFLKGFLFFSG